MYFMKSLTLLLRFENAFGITRVCWNEKRATAIKVFSLVTLVVLVAFLMFVDYNTTNSDLFLTSEIWRLKNILAFVNSIIIIINGFCSSKKFSKLVVSLQKSHFLLKNDHCKKNKFIHRVIIHRLVIYLVMVIVMFYLMVLHKKEGSPFQMYILKFLLFTCDVRFLLEYVVYFFIFYVLSIQINTLSSTILKSRDHLISQVYISNCYVAYNSISECAKTFNEAFGFPIAFAVFTSITDVVFVIYNFIIIARNNFESHMRDHLILTYIMLMPNVVNMFTMSLAGQKVQNSFQRLIRVLAGLLLRLDSKCEQKRHVKNLMRLVAARPVKAEAFGLIPIGNALMLQSIGVVTTTLIIVLQFNNIV